MKAILIMVVAIWAWWIGLSSTTQALPLMEGDESILGYPTLSFHTLGDSYTSFVKSLRKALTLRESERYGIPVLPNPSTISNSNRYLYVQLSNYAAESITLAVDVATAKLVAYQAGERSYFFADIPSGANSFLFTDTQSNKLSFASTYAELEKVAGESMREIRLGYAELDKAIASLRRTNSISQKDQARSLIVTIQSVLGAAKFRYVEQLIHKTITSQESFLPNPVMLGLEDKWVELSSAIQQSFRGIFSSPVKLPTSDQSVFPADSVTGIIVSNLAIMKFICTGQKSSSSSSQFSRLLIKSVVDEQTDNCIVPEPTVRITGRNGLCVDVRDGFYNDGDPIQLWPCKTNSDPNQFFTFRKDKTIRSNGKCVTVYGYASGQHVMIYNCKSAATEATYWEIVGDGTIINPKSSLALTAEKGTSYTTLTVNTNIHSSSQGWLASNNTKPFVTSIVGYMNLCLVADGKAVWVAKCTEKTEQRWAIYGDGTIRPEKDKNRCLSCESNEEGSKVVVLDCRSEGSTMQRWAFQNDGSLWNLRNGLVMDVADSDPSQRKIIMWKYSGSANQLWLPLFETT